MLSAHGRDPLSRWKLTGSVSREYLKDIRGYVVAMEGGSSTTKTRMQLPKTDRASRMSHIIRSPCLSCWSCSGFGAAVPGVPTDGA